MYLSREMLREECYHKSMKYHEPQPHALTAQPPQDGANRRLGAVGRG